MPIGFLEASGAPAVQTTRRDTGWTGNPVQDQQSQVMRMKVPVAPIPTWQPAYQFSVPAFAYKIRGNWTAPDVPTCPGPTYPWPTEAPEIQYRNKSYSALIRNAAQPIRVPPQPGYVLSAPDVVVMITT